ncbi:MAG: hypothetical protein KME29_04695 [Calothrix sp. FI2-JRJ7]|jgi:hypothetical protein|nr:hypothetical protein [Calothrix sp. FI2-JRJ7]
MAIIIDANKLNNAVNNAFDVAIEELSDAYDEALESDIWQWDRTTVRRNGEIVDSPRNAVDEEELINSKVILRKGNKARFEWQAPHAAIVHDGATRADGSDYPARPWTKWAQENSDPSLAMQRKLNKNLNQR